MKFNCHTHTNFCDGKNTAEEMVISAIKKGFNSLGFSGHSPMNFENDYAMNDAGLLSYKEEILRLKKKYEDKIEVYLGLELDADHTVSDFSCFDYIIGSVHQLKFGDRIYAIDNTYEELSACVANEYNSRPEKMARAYFERLSDFISNSNVDVVGHYDLLTKFRKTNLIFDENNEEYISCALDGVRKILFSKPGMIFEINTGAMYRKGNEIPYPAQFILKEIKNLGGRITISSDAHNSESLDFGFEKARETAISCGFESFEVLHRGKWESFKL